MAIHISPLKAGWLLAIIYFVGVIGFLLPQTAAYMPKLISLNIGFTCIVLMVYHRKWDFPSVLTMLLIAASGFFIEVVGVKTGTIFGNYQYGFTLGFLFWDTPIMMAALWLLTIYITRQIAEMIAKDAALVAVISAGLMVLLDFFIEPFAIKTGMWRWNAGQVPLHNYIGWFVCGLIIQYCFIKSIKFPANKLSLPIYLIQLGFFIAIYLLKR